MGNDRAPVRAGAMMWRMLSRVSSLKLTNALLLWIAFACIAATVIPQHPGGYSDGASLTERLLGALTPYDIFHSLWLALPAFLLGLNLLACTTFGLRSFLARERVPAMPKGPYIEKSLPGGIDPAQALRNVLAGLGRGYHVRQSVKSPSSWIVFGEKSRMRAFSSVLAHGGVLVILLGAALGTLGYRGSMEIAEGNTADAVMLSGGGEMRLPFTVRCDRFSVEYYGNGMPREYRSELAFASPGRPEYRSAVMVNHPVRFGGILFSQSGYNPIPTARIAVKKKGALYHAVAEEKTYFILEEEKYQVNVVRLLADVMHFGPAAELLIDTPQGQKHLWVLKDFDRFRARFPGITERMAAFDPSSVSPYTFSLESMTTRYSTVLSLNRDPGEACIAVGAVLFLTGIFVLFLVPKTFVWVSLSRAGEGFTARAAQTVNGRGRIPDQDILGHLAPAAEDRS